MSFLILWSALVSTETSEKPFVLVELFTSEGCSSCPPADKLLSEIVDRRQEDVEVIGLSFHVDYWDYIGWKDPYASSAYTRRQRSYARKFRSSQIYTPQMVVNGKYEFVGSNRAKWYSVFNNLKSKTPSYSIQVDGINTEGNEWVIDVSSIRTEEVILNVAVVERELSQQVTRGENRGRKLEHDNVVRVFAKRQFNGEKNQFKLDIPSDLIVENSSIVLYVQNENTWEVLGAKRISPGS